MILLDYRCDACGTTHELLVPKPAPSSIACSCGGSADRVISAVAFKPQYASVSRGKSEEPPPGVVDTRPLAEGQKFSDWKAGRRKIQFERRERQLRDMGVIW